MGELIRIGAEEGAYGLGATVDTTGAWVTKLSFSGVPVLFPREFIVAEDGTDKVRGGMHVCSPHFGNAGVPAHGFSRISEWQVSNESSAHSLTLELESHGLQQKLGYFVSPNSLLAILKIRNDGLSNVLVAPGFHPYFYAPEGYADLEKDKPRLSSTSHADMNGSSLTDLALKSGHLVQVLARGMQEVIEWSDMLGDYVCAEPTAARDSLDPNHKGVTKLERSEEVIYSLDLAVLSAKC